MIEPVPTAVLGPSDLAAPSVVHPGPLGLIPAGIVGLGGYLPERVVTNDDLSRMVETSDEWIVTRTGIRERRIAGDDQATSDLAAAAAERALADAGVPALEVDLVIVATATGDSPWPATASLVQHHIGAVRAGAFDLNAVCAGFTHALAMAGSYIQTGGARTVLVVGADTTSRLIDWSDRNTCILFGDGAGAAVLRPVEPGDGLLASVMRSDGSGAEMIQVPAGGSRLPVSAQTIEAGQGFARMRGQEVFKWAVRVVGEVAREALDRAGYMPADVDLFVPHQANIRILDAAAQNLGVPKERFFSNLDRVGNTSAASIPLALCDAVQAGRLRPGDLVVTIGFGAGLSWAANVLRWTR